MAIIFTLEEQKFIKRILISTRDDFPRDRKIIPANQQDLLDLLRMARGRGYLTPRRMDGGHDFDLWRDLMKKAGNPVKTRKETIEEHERRHYKGVLDRLTEGADAKIKRLETRLKQAQKEKDQIENKIEDTIQAEINKIEAEKQEKLRRLEVVKKAKGKAKTLRIFEKKKQEKAEEDGGKSKCWICGQWFTSGGAFTGHVRACKKKHPEIESENTQLIRL